MQKKIIYLLLYSLYTTALQGQQHQVVNRLVNNIRSIAVSITKDTSLSTSCKKGVKEYLKSLPAQNNTVISKDVAKKMQAGTILFAGSINDVFRKKCLIERLDELVDSTKQLSAELEKLTKNEEDIKIKMRKTGDRGWMMGIDSISTAIRQVVIKDSLQYTLVLLSADNRTKANLVIDKGNLNDSNFKIQQYQNNLISIQLRKSDSAGIIDATSPEKEGFETQLARVHRQQTIVLFLITLIFFLTLATAFFYYRSVNKLRSFLHQSLASAIGGQTLQPEVEIKNDALIVSPTENFQPVPPEESLNMEEVPVPTSGPNEFSFICEIMMTAGPRKKPMNHPDSDKDLGEDVCGFISSTKEIFTWLLDGTSDDDSWKDPVTNKEYFSSRLLAQSIGDQLRRIYMNTEARPVQEMIGDAIDAVKQYWLEVIERLPGEEKERLKSRIEDKIFPQCSTTALIGHLKSNGDLYACRTGDSQIFMFKRVGDTLQYIESPLTGKNEKGVDRIFFRLQLKNESEFEIVSNKPVFDLAEEGDIHTLIAFSDGIGAATELLLKEQYQNDPPKIKQEIIYQLQGTGDDKCICFIERLPVPNNPKPDHATSP